MILQRQTWELGVDNKSMRSKQIHETQVITTRKGKKYISYNNLCDISIQMIINMYIEIETTK